MQAELVEERRTIAILRGELEALRATHEETRKRSAEMQVELTEANMKLDEMVDLLKKACASNVSLAEEYNQLKLTAIRQKELECGLHEMNATLIEELAGAREKIAELNASIVVEHEKGFYKALRQTTVLLNVHEPFDVGFDIEKDVYGGELVHLGPPTAFENPTDPKSV